MSDDAETGFAARFVTAADGLMLHGRDYPAPGARRAPVVCLPGLARTCADFHELALHLSTHPLAPRRVLALDYRGRGESGRDRNWRNYDPRIEADDVLAFLTALGVGEAMFVGTSRGGLVTFAIAAMRPAAIRGVVLNDIGAVIDARGLVRIRGYVGKMPTPRTLDEAGAILRGVAGAQFTDLTDAEWRRFARRTWREENGRLVPRYDPALMKGLALLDLEKPLPQLWVYFDALRDVPVLVVRGANSDLLSADTVTQMVARRPGCDAFTVPDQGHAPMLGDAPTLDAIGGFLTRAESAARLAA
jgi:pimeloyl-ACP methyl ester carboxylesterase